MPKEILLIEDDEFKANDVLLVVRKELPDSNISVVGDVGSGVNALVAKVYDFVILDIALPSRKLRRGGGTTASLLSGGLEIIYRLEEEKRSDPVAILTQYPDIEIEGDQVPVGKVNGNPAVYFTANIVACVRYVRGNQRSWSAVLEKELRNLL